MAIAGIVDQRRQAAAASAEDEAQGRSNRETWQLIANVSTTGLFVLAALAALYFTRDVVVPVILAWVVANILLPVIAWMERRRLPRVAAVVIATLAFVAIIAAILILLSLPITYWLGRATELGTIIKAKLAAMSQPLSFLNEVLAAVSQVTGQGGSGLHVEENTNIVGGIVGILTPAVSQSILFLGALVFLLVFIKQIKQATVLILPSREARLTALKIMADIERNTTVYFGTFTIVNICLGMVTTLLAYAVGLPNPLLWGVLSAVVNYVPYVGVAIMVAVLFVIGLFTFPTLSQAAIAPLVYIAMTTVEGHLITPAIMGRRMTLNPFAVFLAIGFWTWMWGPIGAFVAVPILMTMTVTVRHIFNEEEPALPG
jgi:predicted PurR-regulated permease PerM